MSGRGHNTLVPIQAVLPVHGDMALEGAIEAYLASAVDSPHTRRAYRRHLREVLACASVVRASQVQPHTLAAIRAALVADPRGLASKRQALAALRGFLRWVGDMGGISVPERALAALLRIPKGQVLKPYQVLTTGETARLMKAAAEPRDRALLAIALGGGLRPSEVVGLDVKDLLDGGLGGALVHVRKGKGAKDRLVPVKDQVVAAVHRYLLASGRKAAAEGPLFHSRDPRLRGRGRPAGRLSDRGFRELVTRLCRAADIAKAISPHSFRHTFAVSYLRQGGNLEGLRRILGHASIETTQVYLGMLELDEFRIGLPDLPGLEEFVLA